MLILALGRALGIVAEKLGFPSLVGELIVGIILGPMALGLIQPPEAGTFDALGFLANIGIIFMMFIMGLSIDLESVLKANARSATSITLIGASLVFAVCAGLTLLVGVIIGQDFYFSLAQACLVGIALTSTSTVIGFKFLSDIGDRFSNVFKTLAAVEVTDGVFSIILLAVLLSIIGLTPDASPDAGGVQSMLPGIAWSTFKLFLLILGFLVFVIKFGGKVTNWMLGVTKKSKDEHTIITLSLIALFAVAGLSEWLEMTAIIGAFLAGAILAGSPYSETVIAPKVKAIGYGLFIPIFFAYTGTKMDFGQIFGGNALNLLGIPIPYYLLLAIGLLVGVMVCKYVGTTIACRLSGGFKPSEVGRIGFSLISVGEDTLVIAHIGTMVLVAGQALISPGLYAVLGLLIIVTSLVSPFLLKKTFEETRYSPPSSPRNGMRPKIKSL